MTKDPYTTYLESENDESLYEIVGSVRIPSHKDWGSEGEMSLFDITTDGNKDEEGIILVEKLKSHHRASVVALLDAVIESEKSMFRQVPTNDLRDVVMALRNPETLSGTERKIQEARDASLRNKHIICAAYNDAKSDTIAALTKLREEIMSSK